MLDNNNKNLTNEENKIEGTPILKLAMVKRLQVKKNLQNNQNSSKNSSNNSSEWFGTYFEETTTVTEIISHLFL